MKRIFMMLVLAFSGALGGTEAGAQAWPTKPIRVIVPFSAGSATDITARVLLDQLSTRLAQPIVVENRGGAGGTIGVAAVAKAEPDGYTILAHSSSLTTAPSFYPNLPYDTARDLAAVIPIGHTPNVLAVSPTRGFKTIHDLVAAAKANPGSLNFSSAGVGTNTHLSSERFRISAKFEAIHVPFKGSPEAITEVIAGRIDFYMGPPSIVLPHVRQGSLLALAVNSLKRASALPDVPTTLEAGFPESDLPPWFGLFLPAKTARDIVDKLHRETLAVLQSTKVQEKLASLGVESMLMSPAEFDAFVKKEIAINATLIKAAGIKAN